MSSEKWREIKASIIFCLFVWTMMLLASLWVDQQLPDEVKVPMHWNLRGEVDRYGSQLEGLYMLPGLTAVMIILFALVPLIEPRRRHMQLSLSAYKKIICAIIIFMGCIHGLILLSSLGKHLDIGRLVVFGIGVLFVWLGNYLGKVRSNFFVGVRTPWTLSSELSWTKTHRLAGWLFFLFGLVQIGTAFFWQPHWAFGIMIGGVLICSLTPMVYSYFIWKRDPNKQTRS